MRQPISERGDGPVKVLTPKLEQLDEREPEPISEHWRARVLIPRDREEEHRAMERGDLRVRPTPVAAPPLAD